MTDCPTVGPKRSPVQIPLLTDVFVFCILSQSGPNAVAVMTKLRKNSRLWMDQLIPYSFVWQLVARSRGSYVCTHLAIVIARLYSLNKAGALESVVKVKVDFF